ncbi:hypothetical protein [Actinokineospora enzanensis]|uniref:hypothetical protein n=1 Tax=Actinokineospora enzanensis TaxID=155975 RepID=UPI000368F42D|nr:hypothetical protein [Actinokineospora enzanensis]
MRPRALAATLAALTLLTPSLAGADPTGLPQYRQLSGTGSAVSEDLYNALSNVVTGRGGTKILGSYDTTGSPTISTKPDCTVPRSYTLHESVAAGDGCLQFARAAAYNSLTRDATYFSIGYAGLTYAIAHDTVVSRALHDQRLRPIYSCMDKANYQPLLPRYGSDVRSEFLRSLWLDDGPDFTTRFPCVRDSIDGVPIAENDGRVLTSPDQIVPYGVPAYLTQPPAQRANADLGRFNEMSFARIDPTVDPDTIVYLTRDTSRISRDLTDAQLKQIYTCSTTGHTPLLPGYGSRVRTQFLDRLGIPNTPDLTTTYPCVRDTSPTGPLPIEDASVLATDTDIVPFDIQTYVDQLNNLLDDTRSHVTVSRVNGVPPVTGKLAGPRNALYAVVPNALAKNPAVVAAFSGQYSAVCRNGALIRALGYVDIVGLGCGWADTGNLNPRGHLPPA